MELFWFIHFLLYPVAVESTIVYVPFPPNYSSSPILDSGWKHEIQPLLTIISLISLIGEDHCLISNTAVNCFVSAPVAVTSIIEEIADEANGIPDIIPFTVSKLNPDGKPQCVILDGPG